ncbi:MAG: hypothetical protein RL348_1429 [Bacteroidota bacterium]|jgi:hypothetical protein
MKSDFYIDKVCKEEIKELLLTYHYLKDESKDFKSGFNYGLYRNSLTNTLNNSRCLGACVFTGLPVPEIAVGAFGLKRNEQQGIYELSRLCIHPDLQKEEYNITSWFVSRCIKRFKKDACVRAILSYADSSYHTGTIYRACNFTYFGLTDLKKDFYYADGTKHSRGPIKGAEGEWKERSRKHRFLLIFDKTLNVKWKEEKWNNF